MTYKIHEYDIVEYLKSYNGEKFHAVLSDPPYGLAFMSKSWDKYTPLEYQQWVTEWASLLLEVLYPGAVCMFFGGTRTYHRLATGLEDAGFEIFDSMLWVYGSGFPKSHNISKAIDKSEGYKPDKIIPASGVGFMNSNDDGWHNTNNQYIYDSYKSVNAHQWNGYGTALKPAYEPIVLCRKPRGKETFVDCALNYGTGSLNVDGSRIETEDDTRRNAKGGENGLNGSDTFKIRERKAIEQINHNGRFPANFGLICECECEPCECIEKELDEQSSNMGMHSAGKQSNGKGKLSENNNSMFAGNHKGNGARFGDTGGASRFFYTAKASRKERNLGVMEFTKKEGWPTEQKEKQQTNNHPTVKPLKLTGYLAKLILPPIDNSRILIPFSGSGSEMIGAIKSGWNYVEGIELNSEYIEIANKRLEYWIKEHETIHS